MLLTVMGIKSYSMRQTLKVLDDKGQLGFILVTHMRKRIPKFQKDLTTRLQGLYGKDLQYDRSERRNYNFTAIHYHWYNRFAEQVCSYNCNCSTRYMVITSHRVGMLRLEYILTNSVRRMLGL
jgi:hypothetical protein